MSITNGRGDELSVSTTEVLEQVATVATVGLPQLTATMLRIWNTGATDVRIMINTTAAALTSGVATAALIPAGEDCYFFGDRKPIENFAYSTEASTSTIKYSAY